MDSISENLKTEHSILTREIEKYNNTVQNSYYYDIDYGFIISKPEWNERFESYLKIANSEMLLNRLKKDLSLSNSSRTVLWKHQEVFHLLIEKNMFHYHFQPIVDARNGDVFGYEALMRTDPVINMRPLEVIEVATNLGKLYEIEWSTMSNMLDYLQKHSELFSDKKLFVNSQILYKK